MDALRAACEGIASALAVAIDAAEESGSETVTITTSLEKAQALEAAIHA